MALFAMDRYLGEEEEEQDVQNQAEEILKKLHKSVEKKRKKLKVKQVETEELVTDITPDEKLLHPKKKRKKSISLDEDSHQAKQKKKVKALEGDKNNELETPDETNPVTTASEEEPPPDHDTTPQIAPHSTAGQQHQEIGGFTVIGAVRKKRAEEVKRVLPEWLAHPAVIHNDVRLHKVPLEDVDYLEEDLIQKLRENQITHLFPVQAQVIPVLLQRSGHSLGRAGYLPNDICCSAPTGSGKTLAFVLPIVQTLRKRVVCRLRALVVLPVTDLATQVYKVFQTYVSGTNLKVGLAIGQKAFANEQQTLVKKGSGGYHSLVDILVATPGRLVDHINQTEGFSVKHVTYLVMDEADRLMEVLKQDWLLRVHEAIYRHTDEYVRRQPPGILTPASTLRPQVPLQKLLFSATLSQNPEKLEELGLFQPKLFTSVVTKLENTNTTSMLESSESQEEKSNALVKGEFIGKFTTPTQLSEFVVTVEPQQKPLFILHLLHNLKFKNVLCFTNSVEACHRLYHLVRLYGDVTVKEFSSSLHAMNRDKIISQFANNKIQMLICTDVMARGMDVENVKCVVSYDSPRYLKTYIHRAGRTGRAGKAGMAITMLQSKEMFHFKKMCQEAGKPKLKKLHYTRGNLKPLLSRYTTALEELEKVLKTASTILDSTSKEGGASRRAGGRDERPPRLSPPSGVETNARQRWVPPCSVRRDAPTPEDKHNVTFRKVRGILNKLTPDKFDKLSLELLNVGIDSQVVLKGIILLIFEKALDEPKYSSLYAQLCHRLCEDAPNFEQSKSSITTFRRLLLNKCQDEFENRSRATEAFDKDGPLSAEEEEQLALAKHKMLGNIKFIGELGKLEMLHEGILHKCIKQLLEKKKRTSLADIEEDLECLCQIMRTVGRRLDTDKARTWMDQYFKRMEQFVVNPELPSRIRFMLQDVIELRSNGWAPRKGRMDKGPRTIQQVREEAAKDYGIYYPPPGANGRGGGPIPLFAPGHPLTGRMGLGAPPVQHPMRGGMSDIFNTPMPGFLGPGDIGTGPGVIHMDPFSPGYSTNMGRNRNNRDPEFTAYRGRRSGETDRDRASPKSREERQGGERAVGGGRGEKAGGDRGGHYRQNKGRGGGNNSNTDALGGASMARELPPRFRKQQQQASPSGAAGTGVGYTGPPPGATPPADGASPPPHYFSSAAAGEEISLRPAKNFPTMFKPNTPSMLPKSAQTPPQHNNLMEPPFPLAKTPAPVLQKATITIKQVSADNKKQNNKANNKEQKCVSKEELKEATTTMLQAYLASKHIPTAIDKVKEIKIPKKLLAEMLLGLMVQTLDRCEEDRDAVSKLIIAMKEAGVITPQQFMDSLSSLVEQMKELEVGMPLTKTNVAKFAAQAVIGDLVSLVELAEPMEGGTYYPLFLLILQQLHKEKDDDWLTSRFQESKINLQNMLPEHDRSKERMMEILEERRLSFMFPLLRVQADLWRHLRVDANPQTLYHWINDNVPHKLVSDPGFINILLSSIVKYVSGETTMAPGTDASQVPDKNAIQKEKDLLASYKGVLQAYLHDKMDLQLTAIYALQVHCHNTGFPKGMLLRMFMYMYDFEIIDEEAFLKWKEEVNDLYPGKGKALFQVNQWLTWLEQAEEEESEEEDD